MYTVATLIQFHDGTSVFPHGALGLRGTHYGEGWPTAIALLLNIFREFRYESFFSVLVCLFTAGFILMFNCYILGRLLTSFILIHYFFLFHLVIPFFEDLIPCADDIRSLL